MVEADLLIPYAQQGRIGEVYEHARCCPRPSTRAGGRLRVRGLPGAIARLTRAFGA